MTDEQKIEKFCSFLQTPLPQMSFRRDHSKVLREVGRRSIELRLHVDKEFKTGGKQVNSKNNSLVLELFSSASVQSSQNIAGPWIRSLLNNQPLLAAYGNTDEHKELTSVEGIVAYFTLSLVWDDEVNAETWTKLSAFWTTLMTVLNSIDEQINNGTQPKKFNSDNPAPIKQYLATIQHPTVKLSSENSSGNLKEGFREWIVTVLGKGPDKAKDYVEHIANLPNKAKETLGEEPSVGIFEVSSCDEFISLYGPAIEWAKKHDPEYKKYWRTSINHYKKFLKGHFSANPVSGSGGLPHVELRDENGIPLSRNLIFFGAPGTGKSHQLKKEVEAERRPDGSHVQDGEDGSAIDYERVTFYPTYSYAQFVGCYKPVMNGSDIAYKFVPGPFLRVLVNALKPGEDGKIKDWCLVIEEINRANAAAVFGDVFQLLDRGSDGVSEYDVAASEDVKRFLQEEFKDCSPSKDDDSEESKKRNPLNFLKVAFKKDAKGNDTKEWDSCRLRIPSNMYIWATMNSADQGVFPMDTAFKRRWEFEYIDIDNGSPDCERWSIEGKYGYKWDAVRRLLNGLLSLHRVNEDKLMGAHFVKPEKGTDTVSEKSFKSKVLMYLWEDAARMCRRQMFGDIGTYSALLNAWDENGVGIFSNDPELEKLKDAAETKKIFDELLTVEPTQPKSDEQTKSDDESASVPAP